LGLRQTIHPFTSLSLGPNPWIQAPHLMGGVLKECNITLKKLP
jgi:hypothetical protein